MRFLDFKEELSDFVVFSLRDIRKIESDFDLRRLNEWQNKGYIKMVRRGYYIFSDTELSEVSLFLIANKIYSPSYVSLEMALSYYNLIPESVYAVTSVTSLKTNQFKTDIGNFIYKSLKPEFVFGYKLVGCGRQNFKIADIEKAILDYFYLNPSLKTEDDFRELRFNIEELESIINREKLNRYLRAFNSKHLEKRVEVFLKYIDHA